MYKRWIDGTPMGRLGEAEEVCFCGAVPCVRRFQPDDRQRRARPWRLHLLVSEGPLVAGLEAGGTKCICILARSPDQVVEEIRVDTRDPGSTLSEVDAIFGRWCSEHGFDAIGISSFGPLDIDRSSPDYGSIVSTPKPGWSGTPIASWFQRFGVPVGLEVDVVGAARAEQRWGAAQGLTDFTYITVGTGIGVGPIIADKSISGRGHCEMGHSRIPRLAGDDWPGSCPFHGDCIEGLASGTAIRSRHGPGPITDDWPGWSLVEHALAMLIHNLLVSTQPKRVLIGGGVIEGRPSLIEAVRRRALESLAGYYSGATLPDDFLSPPGLGTSAGPLGAIVVGLSALGR